MKSKVHAQVGHGSESSRGGERRGELLGCGQRVGCTADISGRGSARMVRRGTTGKCGSTVGLVGHGKNAECENSTRYLVLYEGADRRIEAKEIDAKASGEGERRGRSRRSSNVDRVHSSRRSVSVSLAAAGTGWFRE